MNISRAVIFALLTLYVIVSAAQSNELSNELSNVNNNEQKIHKTKEQAELQVKFVKTLLTTSSAAKKVKTSQDANVKSLYRAANDLFNNALAYMDEGNNDAAAESLYHATVMMFQTAKMAEKKQIVDDSERRIFEARLKTVDALINAMQRIGEEKNISSKTDPIKSKADAEVASAKAMMTSGQPASARKKIDRVYVDIKTAINELRSGDTLVRTLHFETRKDEYLYELDRNETHNMLVTLLLQEQMEDPDARARAQKFLDKAEDIRKQAEESAKKGDYDDAVKRYEESTRLIIQAIRNAGLFIPG